MKPLKIFYIDDEPDLLELFAESISSDTIQVITFLDPFVALAEIKSHKPDIVFIDYRLPGMTGDEVVAKIGTEIPCVILTGELSLTVNGSVKAILMKPYKLAEIHKIISEIKQSKKTA